MLKSAIAAAAAAIGFTRLATPVRAQTKHIRLYVEMDLAPAREKEMLETFHNVFVPEAVKHEGHIRVKNRTGRESPQGTAPPHPSYRFEREFGSEELRQAWIASAGRQRVWPLVGSTMKTQKDCPI